VAAEPQPAAAIGGVDAAALVNDGNAAGAPACSACHGSQGQGNPDAGYPRLAGLAAAYIRHELDSFADGSRSNEIMSPAAKALSPAERDALAAFYSARQTAGEERSDAAGNPDAATLARGLELARAGDWGHGLPPCGQCHGPQGQGVGNAFPSLAGQPAAYLSAQIDAWKAGTRRNDPLGLMAGISAKLSDPDASAVAAYYATLPPPGSANGKGGNR
jgi:cytochrome c553